MIEVKTKNPDAEKIREAIEDWCHDRQEVEIEESVGCLWITTDGSINTRRLNRKLDGLGVVNVKPRDGKVRIQID